MQTKPVSPFTARRLLPAGIVTAFLLAGAWLAMAGEGNAGNPGIIPPNAEFRGLSYGEWEAKWWSTVFSLPVVAGSHPLVSGGAFNGDKDVVFLSGTWGGETLEVTVALGTALFIPVVNTECSIFEPDPFHGENEAELRACANGWIDGTTALSASIDGLPVENLEAYRSQSPLFAFTLPDDNIFDYWGYEAPTGTTSLSVDAGVYLLLSPLSKGTHTIHIEATFTQFGGSINTTYIVTVE